MPSGDRQEEDDVRIPDLTLTPALRAHLEREHDDGSPRLVVRQEGDAVLVERQDGSELSEREAVGVRGLVAAHRVEPLRPLRTGRPRLDPAQKRGVKLTVRWTVAEAAELATAAEAQGETTVDLVRRATLAEARRALAAKRRPRKN
jgi:hypothetical protein